MMLTAPNDVYRRFLTCQITGGQSSVKTLHKYKGSLKDMQHYELLPIRFLQIKRFKNVT